MWSININIFAEYLKIIIMMIAAPKRSGVMEFEVWPYPPLVIRFCD